MGIDRRLTRTQKRLIDDLDKMMFAFNLDYWNILDRDPRYDQHRTIVLQSILREIVRGEVISQYTLIDEQLSLKMCRYMFGGTATTRLWKTKKFERFNYYVIEKLSLMEKLAFVKDVYGLSKGIIADIEAINAIRNALAHAFFPENLRAYRSKRRHAVGALTGPRYKGANVFTLNGVERFLSDSRRVVEFLIMDVRRKKGAASRGAS
jgi:hypothetical protein